MDAVELRNASGVIVIERVKRTVLSHSLIYNLGNLMA